MDSNWIYLVALLLCCSTMVVIDYFLGESAEYLNAWSNFPGSLFPVKCHLTNRLNPNPDPALFIEIEFATFGLSYGKG